MQACPLDYRAMSHNSQRNWKRSRSKPAGEMTIQSPLREETWSGGPRLHGRCRLRHSAAAVHCQAALHPPTENNHPLLRATASQVSRVRWNTYGATSDATMLSPTFSALHPLLLLHTTDHLPHTPCGNCPLLILACDAKKRVINRSHSTKNVTTWAGELSECLRGDDAGTWTKEMLLHQPHRSTPSGTYVSRETDSSGGHG
jgi:hypothetical protein